MRDVNALPLGCCVFTELFIVIIRAPEVANPEILQTL